MDLLRRADAAKPISLPNTSRRVPASVQSACRPSEEEPQREDRRQRHHVTLCQAPSSEQPRNQLSLAGILERGRAAQVSTARRDGASEFCFHVVRQKSIRNILQKLEQSSIVRLDLVARVLHAPALHVGYGRFKLGLISALHVKDRTDLTARMMEDSLTLASSLHGLQVVQDKKPQD